MRFKAAIILLAALVPAAALSARDIHVRAGGPGGDGSRERPYSDISEALLAGAYSGDVIRVAEGVYYGEGGSGRWRVATPGLVIAGGYSADFSERAPFVHRSILARGISAALVPLAKARGHDASWGLSLTPTKAGYEPGPLLQVEAEDVVVDGLWIDGYTRLSYKPSGELRLDLGPIGAPLAAFSKRGGKLRNCVLMNSGGPGVQMACAGTEGKADTWNEVAHCVIVNVLMAGIDMRVGTRDPERSPDSGCALVRGNTVAFVWSNLGLGYGIVVGRQTRIVAEGNLFAWCEDAGVHNGYGNAEATLSRNVFHACGTAYRYWAGEGSIAMLSCDDPALLSGASAASRFSLSAESGGNGATADPGLPVDAAFLANYLEGPHRMIAPVYEHSAALLFSRAVSAGASDRAPLAEYASIDAPVVAKDYAPIEYAAMKDWLGKDVELRVKLARSPEPSGFYVEGVTKEGYVCYRSADLQHFFYFKKGSAMLAAAEKAAKSGGYLLVKGTLRDIKAAIKMSGKFGFTVDAALPAK